MSNPSSLLVAMETTLEAIKQVREILDQESHNLSPGARYDIEARLSKIESGLIQEKIDLHAHQYTQAPHLYDDDDEVKSIWKQLGAICKQRR